MPDDAPRAGGETPAEQDFHERLASIKRCIPHMHDVGGIWPRDVEWLIAELERSRASLLARHRDGERLDWLQRHPLVIPLQHDASGWRTKEAVMLREFGPFASLRDAIDAAMSAPPSPERASK